MKKKQPLPTAEQLETLPALVKIHVGNIHMLPADAKAETRVDGDASKKYLKNFIEAVCKDRGNAEVEVCDVVIPIDKDGDHFGYGFVWVRKEHLVPVLQFCDQARSMTTGSNLLFSVARDQDYVAA